MASAGSATHGTAWTGRRGCGLRFYSRCSSLLWPWAWESVSARLSAAACGPVRVIKARSRTTHKGHHDLISFLFFFVFFFVFFCFFFVFAGDESIAWRYGGIGTVHVFCLLYTLLPLRIIACGCFLFLYLMDVHELFNVNTFSCVSLVPNESIPQC